MKNYEEEYLEILSSIDESCCDDVRLPLPSQEKNILPKVKKTSQELKTSIRKPLATRTVLQEEETDLDYLEAELPIIKTPSKNNTFVPPKEPQKTSSQKTKPNEKKKKRSPKRVFSFIFIVIIIFVAVYSATKLGLWHDENEESDRQMTEIQAIITETIVDSKEDTTPLTSTMPAENKTTDYSKLSLVDIDFQKLLEVNPDTVAYIKINGLDINAPIVQTTDNDFYLEHSYDKTPNSAGWIFGDYRDDWKELKDNTIVYGHNRRNYAMFGSLKLILEEKWYKNTDNYFIYISTENANMIFQMFSAYNIPTTSDYLQNTFTTKDEYREFLDMLKNRSQVDFGNDVTENDKIITLSTCYTNTSKTVVHAKLIKIQEK